MKSISIGKLSRQDLAAFVTWWVKIASDVSEIFSDEPIKRKTTQVHRIKLTPEVLNTLERCRKRRGAATVLVKKGGGGGRTAKQVIVIHAAIDSADAAALCVKQSGHAKH